MKTVLYFAYGSNMNESRLQQRGVTVVNKRPATLPGYRLTFDKIAGDFRHGYATLCRDKRASVEGILYTILAEDLLRLDRYEGVPHHYQRISFPVGKSGIGYTYVATPQMIAPGLTPTREYLGHLLKGRPYLSQPYYQELRSWL